MSKANDIATYGQYQPQRRNIVINGGMNIAQRGTEFVDIATLKYCLDRWRYVQNGTALANVQQQSNSGTPALTTAYLIHNVSTADTVLVPGNHCFIQQYMEGNNTAALGWQLDAQSSKQDITISFWHAHTLTGTHCVALRNADASRSYVTEYTQSVADTWEYHSFTVPAPTDGTWEVDTNVGIQLSFCVANGSTFATSNADTWESSNYVSTTNQVNNNGAISNKMRFTGIQFEMGTEATDFEYRSFGEELALCKRYFEKSYQYDDEPGTITTNGFWSFFLTGLTTAAHTTASVVRFAVEKRVETMTITAYSNVTGASGKLRDNVATANDVTPTLDAAATGGFRIYIVGKSANNINVTGHWTADAEIT